MANNYLEFSESIEHLTTKELRWWLDEEQKVQEADDIDCENGDVCLDFFIQEPAKTVWFHSENGNPDAVGNIVQRFLKAFRPAEFFSLTWAEYCSRPRIGEFNGGAIFVTANEIKFQTCEQWIHDTKAKWENS